MANENKGIYFTELKLQNVRCFGDEAILKLSNDNGEWQRWNVILGDNGTGKTTLLQCLAGMEQNIYNTPLPKDEVFTSESILCTSNKNQNFIKIGQENEIDILDKMTKVSSIVKSKDKEFRLGFTQYMKDIIVHGEFEFEIFDENDECGLFILGYGANRFMSSKILTDAEVNPEISATLFDVDAKLINTKEWFMQRDYSLLRNSGMDAALENRNKIFELFEEILPDIEKIRLVEKSNNDKNFLPLIEFKTPYGWVNMDNLSLGYKSMVAWILDVFARMYEKYPNFPNPLHEPVVILVDEIDLHLHPKWQRQIFEFLQKRFPKAQFIVTAHSPLIVQSAPKDANIIVLKKEKEENSNDFVVKIINDKNYVRNWRIDQILSSDLFDIGTRNPEVEKQMEERTKLIQKEKLTKKEQERLDELNEISHSLPTADSPDDIEAMEIIREAAAYLKKKSKGV